MFLEGDMGQMDKEIMERINELSGRIIVLSKKIEALITLIEGV